MAPELFTINNKGKSGLPTCESDAFALGMVTFEARNVCREILFHDSETPFCAFFQVFTGRVPFAEDRAEDRTSVMIMKKITDGERPPRPPEGKNLGLSDEFWKVIQSSLAHEVEKRPPVETFVVLLEKATPNITVLEELTNFDANSEDDIQKLRHMFGYGDNTLLGMRENETLAVVEVFDRVSPLAHHSSMSLERFRFRLVLGS
jgi:serine/threonine protein kinase